MHKKLGGDIARTGDSRWPEGCPVLDGSTLSNKTLESGQGWVADAQGLAVLQSTNTEQLHWASLVLYILLSSLLFYFLFCPVKLSLFQAKSFTFF